MTHKPEFDTKAQKAPAGAATPAVCDTNKQEAKQEIKIVQHYANGVMRSAP